MKSFSQLSGFEYFRWNQFSHLFRQIHHRFKHLITDSRDPRLQLSPAFSGCAREKLKPPELSPDMAHLLTEHNIVPSRL